MQDGITIILKMTNLCNLSCDYCFYTQETTRSRSSTMPISNAIQAIESAALHWSKIRVVLHGGEPLLLGIDYLSDLLEHIATISNNTKSDIHICMQTNGTLFSNKFAELLSTYNVSVGVSLDGPAISSSHRYGYSTKNEIHSKVCENIVSMKEAGLNPSAIVVASKLVTHAPDATYNFFKSIGLNFRVNEMAGAYDSSLLPSTQELSTFLCRLFDIWIHDDQKPILQIKPLSSICASFWRGKVSDCSYRNSCTNFLSIEPDGSVFICGRFNHIENMTLGNIFIDSWDDILNSSVFSVFKNRESYLPNVCQACEWFQFCMGGCPATAVLLGKGIYSKTPWCETRKSIFRHISFTLKSILKKEVSENEKQF